ncbi:MAG TPA: tetratricopeptide repeat protein [Candidatus Sumerlaeota bacterium]|nr:tetratricopeptide repeat protein [Candidatus Sumerlaeota bacterium]
MTRSTKSVLYNGLIMSAVFLAAVVVWYSRREIIVPFVIVFLGVILPGAIQGFFWEDLFAGRRHLERGRWDKSLEHFERFLAVLHQRPWLRRLALLRLPRFTASPKALVLSNMGLAFLNKGDKDKAGDYFRKALDADPCYGVPFFNLAVIALMNGDNAAARDHWEKARTAGCTRMTLEQMKPLARELNKSSV